MNNQEYDILNALLDAPYENQRSLAERSGHSLGVVNRSVKALTAAGFLDEQFRPTEKAKALARETAPKSAIILAAGFGMRMVPINMETPKALLEVNGEPLIERILRQLHAVGITRIFVVVGFMKEQFEYLIDDFAVTLVVNPEYSRKNNLHSLHLAAEHLSNSYVIPCDLWCAENPFRTREFYSWYMVGDAQMPESNLRVNRRMELVSTASGGNAQVGISYLLEPQAQLVRQRLAQLAQDGRYDNAFWEAAIYEQGKLLLPARVVPASSVVEINTYEQLRELDGNSNQLKSDAISVICKALSAEESEITGITVLKKGMTNRSFLFSCRNRKYIMRIPGEGTDRLINRAQEAAVYEALEGREICDDVVYLNPENGYKITEFWESARVCDPANPEDVRRCMQHLRAFHEQGLQVSHEFDLFRQLNYYESLWNGAPSVYKDYAKTKQNVLSLKAYIDAQKAPPVLTHIDAVADNFLFLNGGALRLIDWEYAGMQDPHVDIAMFCIYALYDRQQVEEVIRAYFPEGCPEAVRIKIYCYIAVCGLLWSNWCEYKRNLGVEFGEYALRQYRYAKDYYRLVQRELGGAGCL